MRKLWLILALTLGLLAPAPAQVPSVFPAPQGGQPNAITASTTGTTGSFTATLTGVAGRWTYICGFVLTSAGTTAATSGTATVSGTISSTLNFTYVFVSSGQGILGISFGPSCISSSAINTNIVVTMPAGGAGTTAAISAWGYTN